MSVSNNEINRIKNYINVFYTSFISDENTSYMFKYMEDISQYVSNPNINDSIDNNYSNLIKKMFLLNIDKVNPIFNTTLVDVVTTENGFFIFNTTKLLVEIFIQYTKYMDNTYDYFAEFTNVTKIHILSDNEFISNTTKVIRSPEYASGLLRIYVASSSIDITFDKTIDTYNRNYLLNKEDVIKNHLFYILNMTINNAKTQIYALTIYYTLVLQYIDFYRKSENFLLNNCTGDECLSYCDKLNEVLVNLNNITNSLNVIDDINNTSTLLDNSLNNYTDDDRSFKYDNCKYKYVCPNIIIELPENTLFENENVIEDEYSVIIGSNSYQIINHNLNIKKNIKYLNTITLFASGLKCNNMDVPIIKNITKGDSVSIQINKKNIRDFKLDYNNSTKRLNKYNKNIELNKKNINQDYELYNLNKNKDDLLNTQIYIYICLYIIITLFLFSALTTNENGNKRMLIIFLYIFIFILLYVNKYIYNKYISEFNSEFKFSRLLETFIDTEENNGSSCSNLRSDVERINYLQYISNIFTINSCEYLKLAINSLPSLETIDLYKRISKSLKNEKSSFRKYNNYYDKKNTSSKEKIEILKHNIISKTSLLDLITLIYLVVVSAYIIYMFFPEYIIICIVITLILIIYLIMVYINDIVSPVRTYSKNKYWGSPSKTLFV